LAYGLPFRAQAQSANPARVGFLDLLCLETAANDIVLASVRN
jgi:hypothetical protein